MLASHGRYDYSAIVDRPVYDWPNGRRLAVHFCINVECLRFGGGHQHSLFGGDPKRDHGDFAWVDFGNRVGIWRLLQAIDDLELPAAALLNTDIYTLAPEIPAAFRRRGDEFVTHGRTNAERQSDMSREEEDRCIREATETIARHEGASPTGWLGPWRSETPHTLDLLKAAGYRYTMDWPMDEQPVWLRTANGPLLAVPYPSELNDSQVMIRRGLAANLFAENLIAEFDQMLRDAERYPLVLGVALHTHVIAQPFRMAYFRRFLDHVGLHREDVWLARPGEIADHVASLPAGTVPGSAVG